MSTATLAERSPAVCCWCGGTLARGSGTPWVCLTPACQRRQLQWGLGLERLTAKGRRTGEVTQWLYVPTPKQVDFHACPAPYRLYGGAAGPGKSHALRWGLYRKALTIPGFEGLLLRRTFPELRKTHLRRMAREVPVLGGTFLKSEHLAEFPNGSIVECGHLEDEAALDKYLSSEYDEIDCDEGSTFDGEVLLELSTRARSTKAEVTAAGGAVFAVGTNPGGPGWPVLCDFFVTHTPDLDQFPALRGRYDPAQWVYVKARLEDNPYLGEDYERSLAVLNEARYRQLRWGDEFVTEGAFFSQWREHQDGAPWHVRDMDVTGCDMFASMDWGFSSPGCVLWWACLPDGHYHIVAEYKFRETSAEEVAQQIQHRTRTLGLGRLRYVVCDPAMKARTGAGRGEAIFETLVRYGLPMRPGDNDRMNGWARCRELLRAAPDGRPWLTVASDCAYGRRTIPAMVIDPKDPEDLDTRTDDHWVDAWRYGAMSRPSPTRPRAVRDDTAPPNSWGWWRRWHHRQEQPTGVLA